MPFMKFAKNLTFMSFFVNYQFIYGLLIWILDSRLENRKINYLYKSYHRLFSTVKKHLIMNRQRRTAQFLSLCEKYPNTEFFVVRIFLYSVPIQENTDQKNSVFGHFSRCICVTIEMYGVKNGFCASYQGHFLQEYSKQFEKSMEK